MALDARAWTLARGEARISHCCVAAAIVGAGVVAGGASIAASMNASSASDRAAQIQSQAATNAAQLQADQFAQTRASLAPFIGSGSTAMTTLNKLTGADAGGNPLTAPLTAKFQPTMEQLSQTPGYKFTLDQGLQATQNSYAAQGLGTSGAALKGASNYAEGLASTTFQNQFQNYLAQNQQIYNMLAGQAQIGESAAAGQGAIGAQTASGIAGTLTSGAAASAAGQIGQANALTAGLSGISGAASNTALLYALNSGGLFTKPSTTPTNPLAPG